ncbi:hypothetical protein C8R44DRAFT_865294 [Mycena epipterygia]|nr:hypothetical protein C8R44DRAFT_865294 [Mycena epipterygia]
MVFVCVALVWIGDRPPNAAYLITVLGNDRALWDFKLRSTSLYIDELALIYRLDSSLLWTTTEHRLRCPITPPRVRSTSRPQLLHVAAPSLTTYHTKENEKIKGGGFWNHDRETRARAGAGRDEENELTLWAIMLRNLSDTFISQSTWRKFPEDPLTSSRNTKGWSWVCLRYGF